MTFNTKYLTCPFAGYLAFLVFLFLPNLALANDSSVKCVQTFLDFHKLQPGPIDGELGAKTVRAAAKYLKKTDTDLTHLSIDSAGAWCKHARSRKEFATLLAFDGVKKPKNKTGLEKYDSFLLGNSVSNYKEAVRNIKNPRALEFVALDNGMTAARITVNHNDKGHREDWTRNGRPGLAQRFELTEKDHFFMQPNKTYWYRMSVFVPKGTEIKDHLTITDFKPLVKKVFMDPIMAFDFAKNRFRIQHSFGHEYKCKYRRKNGRNLTVCDQTITFYDVKQLWDMTGRWLHMVYRVQWSGDNKGTVHFWLNDKLIVGLQADTMLAGTQHIRNKFGLYRRYHETQGKRSPDVSMYFAGIGRAQSCEELALPNCAKLKQDTKKFETPGIMARRVEEVNDLSNR